jgi:hypothetical protein
VQRAPAKIAVLVADGLVLRAPVPRERADELRQRRLPAVPRHQLAASPKSDNNKPRRGGGARNDGLNLWAAPIDCNFLFLGRSRCRSYGAKNNYSGRQLFVIVINVVVPQERL